MDDTDRDDELEDSFDDSETSNSSDSNSKVVFEVRHPFVLELHELKRDDPNAQPAPLEKVKKHKKKKRQLDANKTHTSSTSSSPSDTSVPTRPLETTKEEFYDAHESYHALPENQASSVIAPAPTAALVIAHSEHGQAQKLAQEPPAPGQTSTTPRDPSSTITKPVAPPN